MTPGFSYRRAASIKDAVTGLSEGNGRILAGGTDLLGCLRDSVFTTDMVVSITGIKELKRIDETPGGGLSIGALATITEVSENPVIRERYPALAQAAAEVASPRITSYNVCYTKLLRTDNLVDIEEFNAVRQFYK